VAFHNDSMLQQIFVWFFAMLKSIGKVRDPSLGDACGWGR
jgi:hypothetical protein